MNSFIYTGNEVSMVINSVPYTVDDNHPRFADVIEALKRKDYDSIPAMISLANAIERFGHGAGVVVDEDAGVVFYNGNPLHNTLTQRLVRMMHEGFDIKPLTTFIENLMKNPSKRAIDELYTFLEYGKLPITEDGHFLAYKRVRDSYLDVHSGTCLNKPASLLTEEEVRDLPYKTNNGVTVCLEDGVTTLSMERNAVQDNPTITCSTGLHFCLLEYLGHFGGSRIVLMKINPADVVSIPVDYNNTKGRCMKYQVVGEYVGSFDEAAFDKSVVNSDGSEYQPADFSGYDEDYRDDEEGEDGILGPQPSADYIEGYVKGHKDGRKREVEEVRPIDLERGGVWAVDGNDYGVGYVDGYKDGKSHKARRYTLD